MQQVLISLSSFGAAETRRHGQLYFARLARAAGADGFEVRGELLVDAQRELRAPQLAVAAGLGGAEGREGDQDRWHGIDGRALSAPGES